MATDVIMPQMGESIFEGTITKWLKKPGDRVERDEPLFEISTDKVDAEIPSPTAGVLKEIKVNEGQTVPIQTVVAVIDAGGAAAAPAPAAKEEKHKNQSRAVKGQGRRHTHQPLPTLHACSITHRRIPASVADLTVRATSHPSSLTGPPNR